MISDTSPPRIVTTRPLSPLAWVASVAAVVALLTGSALLFSASLLATPSRAAQLTPEQAAANVPRVLPSDLPPSLPPGVPAIIHVPADSATIQGAVDRAAPGQIILIAPGIYHEAVKVTKPHITLRGADRTGVILDGRLPGGKYLGDGVSVGPGGDDVIIENMTARYYYGNGFYWADVSGYRGSYLTAYNNGDYGVYAFASRRGQFDHDYASGSPDSGIYIGQCYPCDALVTHVLSENNALGYSGTNAGGNLVLRDSVWRHNGTGIVPNTLDSEKGAPQHETTIVHNLVYDNNNDTVPFKRLEYPPFGIGIVTPGGANNLIMDNTVEGQRNYGILVSGNIDENLWIAQGNRVVNNTVSGSGIADIGLTAPAGPDNCFSGNRVTKAVPALLQQLHSCDTGGGRMSGGDLGVFFALLSRFATASSWSTSRGQALQFRWQHYLEPPPQPNMPGAVDAPAQGIFTESWTSGSFDMPDPDVTNATKAVAAVGLGGLFEILLGFYSYLLPIALYAAWVGIGLWDLARRDEMKSGARYGWMAAIIGVPLLGAIAYYVLGRSTLSRGFRWMMVGGSLGIWLVATTVLLWLSTL